MGVVGEGAVIRRAALVAVLCVAAPAGADSDVVLAIPDRAQDAAAPPSGWCAESAIQQALLHHGMWASQRFIHDAGHSKHPDLYSQDIVPALTALGVRFESYVAKTKAYDAYASWVAASVDAGDPVFAGVKLLPTTHPEWGLDHFVLAVGHGSKGLLVNTTWGGRVWASDASEKGISFRNAFFALRIRGIALPKGATPARLSVVEETSTDVKLRVECGGEKAFRIERRVHAADDALESAVVAAPAAKTFTVARAQPARFACVPL